MPQLMTFSLGWKWNHFSSSWYAQKNCALCSVDSKVPSKLVQMRMVYGAVFIEKMRTDWSKVRGELMFFQGYIPVFSNQGFQT